MNSRGGILFVSFYAVQFKALGKRLICGQRVSKPTLRARAAKGHLETFPALLGEFLRDELGTPVRGQ